MPVEPYLEFNGRTEEALEFYKQTLGAEVQCILRFKDHPECMNDPNGNPPPPDKIMHSLFTVRGTNIMASDCTCSGDLNFAGFSLSITVDTAEEVETLFKALAEGGQVLLPPTKMFFSESFCNVKDKFGVAWLVLVESPANAV